VTAEKSFREEFVGSKTSTLWVIVDGFGNGIFLFIQSIQSIK